MFSFLFSAFLIGSVIEKTSIPNSQSLVFFSVAFPSFLVSCDFLPKSRDFGGFFCSLFNHQVCLSCNVCFLFVSFSSLRLECHFDDVDSDAYVYLCAHDRVSLCFVLGRRCCSCHRLVDLQFISFLLNSFSHLTDSPNKNYRHCFLIQTLPESLVMIYRVGYQRK